MHGLGVRFEHNPRGQHQNLYNILAFVRDFVHVEFADRYDLGSSVFFRDKMKPIYRCPSSIVGYLQQENGYAKLDGAAVKKTEDHPGCLIYCTLSKFDWYWGDIERSEAEALVIKHPGTFIIRACNDTYSILCVTFKMDLNPVFRSTSSISNTDSVSASIFRNTGSVSHIRLLHYQGLFSMDKRDYVPVEKLPEHCARVGRDKNLFNAKALRTDKQIKLIFNKNKCKQ